MFRKIFIFTSILFFVVWCGWDDEDVEQTSWLVLTETEKMSIEVPANWEVIENKEEILPKARDGEIELAVTSKNIVNWFANNLLILSDELNTYTTSRDFSMLNNIWAETDYLDYKKLESKEFKFLDEELSVIYIFEAKYNIDTPKLKFLQTAHICNQKDAFFLTLAIPTSTQDTEKYEDLLSTFKCK